MSKTPTTVTIQESELGPWYRAGWAYVARDDTDASVCVLRWDLASEPVQPFSATLRAREV